MLVRLSHYQQRAVQARVPELHATAMREHRTAYGKSQHDVELPPIAWRQILDTMRDQCFGPAGGRLDRGVPKSAYSAIKRIADAVMRIENHPALTERAVEGWVGEVVLGWVRPGEAGFHAYPSIYCTEGYAYWMIPQHVEVHGRNCTVWSAVNHYPYTGTLPWSLDHRAHARFFFAAQSSPSI